MGQSSKKISYRNGDRASTPALLLLFAGITIGLHLLFALCFHSTPVEEQRPVPEQQRTIRMIAAKDIDVDSAKYRLADPTVFVHGSGRIGYNQTAMKDDKQKPELSVAVEPLVLSAPEKHEPEEITSPERNELPYISVNAPLLGAPETGIKITRRVKTDFPVLFDLSGKDLNSYFSETQIAALKALDARGQTMFRIKPGAGKKLQYHVLLLESCGKASADLAAKKILEDVLTDTSFKKIVPNKTTGLVVRLCWSQLAETPVEKELPAMMFPEEVAAGKGAKK